MLKTTEVAKFKFKKKTIKLFFRILSLTKRCVYKCEWSLYFNIRYRVSCNKKYYLQKCICSSTECSCALRFPVEWCFSVCTSARWAFLTLGPWRFADPFSRYHYIFFFDSVMCKLPLFNRQFFCEYCETGKLSRKKNRKVGKMNRVSWRRCQIPVYLKNY